MDLPTVIPGKKTEPQKSIIWPADGGREDISGRRLQNNGEDKL